MWNIKYRTRWCNTTSEIRKSKSNVHVRNIFILNAYCYNFELLNYHSFNTSSYYKKKKEAYRYITHTIYLFYIRCMRVHV